MIAPRAVPRSRGFVHGRGAGPPSTAPVLDRHIVLEFLLPPLVVLLREQSEVTRLVVVAVVVIVAAAV